MTFGKLSFFGFTLWFLLGAEKVVFYKILNLDTLFFQMVFGLLLFAIAMGCVRRLGVLNYLEAILTCFLWFMIVLVLDYLFVAPILGEYFSKWQTWVAYFLMVLAIFFFHKKRHVQIRKEQHAHHGHH